MFFSFFTREPSRKQSVFHDLDDAQVDSLDFDQDHLFVIGNDV